MVENAQTVGQLEKRNFQNLATVRFYFKVSFGAVTIRGWRLPRKINKLVALIFSTIANLYV